MKPCVACDVCRVHPCVQERRFAFECERRSALQCAARGCDGCSVCEPESNEDAPVLSDSSDNRNQQ